MHQPLFAFLTMCLLSTVAPGEEQPTVIHDEAEQGDFGADGPDAEPRFRLDKAGVYLVRGTGIDSLDDVDAFTFEIAGDLVFDFCLIADPAEFKKLRTLDTDGKETELAFASTNPSFGVPRNIHKTALPPGKYHVEMYMGPQGAVGDWSLKLGLRGKDSPADEKFCEPPPELTSAAQHAGVSPRI